MVTENSEHVHLKWNYRRMNEINVDRSRYVYKPNNRHSMIYASTKSQYINNVVMQRYVTHRHQHKMIP